MNGIPFSWPRSTAASAGTRPAADDVGRMCHSVLISLPGFGGSWRCRRRPAREARAVSCSAAAGEARFAAFEPHGEPKRRSPPGSLVQPDSPAHQLDELLEMARPRPVPPNRRVVEASAWAKARTARPALAGDADAGVGDLDSGRASRRSLTSRSTRTTTSPAR